MPKAIAQAQTFLKAQLLGSEDLAAAEKIFVPKGHVFYVTEVAPDRHQHLWLKLASPLTASDGATKLQEVYAYEPHVTVEGQPGEPPVTGVIKLAVPYFSQIDNDATVFGPGWRQCNTTSNAMLADFLLKGELTQQAKAKGYPEPESVYMRIVKKYGDTIDHGAQTKALQELGIESYFSYTICAKDILSSLQKHVPVVVGLAYKGSGHICIIVGHDPEKKAWLLHDPYGTRHGASDSYDVGVGGAFDPYSYDTMDRIFWDLGREAGWGRVVTAVRGVATGLPTGL